MSLKNEEMKIKSIDTCIIFHARKMKSGTRISRAASAPRARLELIDSSAMTALAEDDLGSPDSRMSFVCLNVGKRDESIETHVEMSQVRLNPEDPDGIHGTSSYRRPLSVLLLLHRSSAATAAAAAIPSLICLSETISSYYGRCYRTDTHVLQAQPPRPRPRVSFPVLFLHPVPRLVHRAPRPTGLPCRGYSRESPHLRPRRNIRIFWKNFIPFFGKKKSWHK